MTTRIQYKIKYLAVNELLTSQFFRNYDGEDYCIRIHNYKNKNVFLYILNERDDVKEYLVVTSVAKAKRKARELLITKYNINLNEEVRNRETIWNLYS